MKLIAEATIELPFTLDFCAQGREVEPLSCDINGYSVILYFPPSLSAGTDGQGIFGDWAWWTGRSLHLRLESDLDSTDDVDSLRAAALSTGDEVLRRFLNAYRLRFGRAAVHPVRIDARSMTLEALHDGRREALTEPFSSFFYQTMPSEPPLDKSVNNTTLQDLQDDVCEAREPSLAEQLRLDAEALETQGERARAELVRRLIDPQQ